MANYKAVGRISGNPLNGLCERMCINVDCVIDACRSRRDGQNVTATLSDFTGGTVAPFTYVDAHDTGDSSFTVDSVESTEGNCRSVSGTLNVPMIVQYRDANGTCGCARCTMELTRQLMLRVPESETADYRFDGRGIVVCTSGAFLSNDVISLTFCIVETYKTLVNADILVPTYGFAVYPDCTECNGCNRLLNLPIFPETE